MKKLLLLLPFTVLNIHAETVDETIDMNCQKQAVALAQQLKADIYTDMNKDQASKIIRLSAQHCKQQFAAKESMEVLSKADEEKSDSKSSDWFTEKVLSGEPAEKAGNKRLKRMQTK